MSEPFILFQIAGSTYGVPSAQVQQVEMVENVTPVPNAPGFVEGVVYLRGRVVPVINLRRRFGMEKIPYDLQSRLIIVLIDGRAVGLAVDSAREFVSLSEDQILPPPENLAGPGIEYLEGVVSLQERLILVVNLLPLISVSEEAWADRASAVGYNGAVVPNGGAETETSPGPDAHIL